MTSKQPVRTREPERRQGLFVFQIPEDQLAENHTARVLWRLVETLDLSGFVEDAKSVQGHCGRDRLSVRMLLTLWLYAISRGISSAREIERLSKSDDAFRWIVGDQTVSHSTLSGFRVGYRAALEKLMTDILGALLQQGLVELDFVAQDGTRIRASASAPSFRSEAALQQCLEQAALHVKAVMAEADDPEATNTEKAARLGAAMDYRQRVQRAIEVVHELKANDKETTGIVPLLFAALRQLQTDASVVPIFLATCAKVIPLCTSVSASSRCSSVNLRPWGLFFAFLLLAIDASQLVHCQPFWGRPSAPQLTLSLVDFPGQFEAELWGSKHLG